MGKSVGNVKVLGDVQQSNAFSREGEGTTTWANVQDRDGNIYSAVLEELQDLPTIYPIDPDLTGVSAAYGLFVDAQMNGADAAREYAAKHSSSYRGLDVDSIGDGSEERRRLKLEKVKANAKREGTKRWQHRPRKRNRVQS